MAALTEAAALKLHAITASTTAEAWGLTSPVKYVYITNRTAATTLFCTVKVDESFVADDTGVTVAVASADETFVVPAGKTKCVFQSARKMFVRGSVIGSTSDYSVEGSLHPLTSDFD